MMMTMRVRALGCQRMQKLGIEVSFGVALRRARPATGLSARYVWGMRPTSAWVEADRSLVIRLRLNKKMRVGHPREANSRISHGVTGQDGCRMLAAVNACSKPFTIQARPRPVRRLMPAGYSRMASQAGGAHGCQVTGAFGAGLADYPRATIRYGHPNGLIVISTGA